MLINLNTATDDEIRTFAEDNGLLFDAETTVDELKLEILSMMGVPSVGGPKPSGPDPRSMSEKERWSHMVAIEIHKNDDDSDHDDVFVGVNNKNFLIQRGVVAPVPWPVYEALKNAREQKTVQKEDPVTHEIETVTREVPSYPFNVHGGL